MKNMTIAILLLASTALAADTTFLAAPLASGTATPSASERNGPYNFPADTDLIVLWVSNARDPTRGMSAADKAAYLRQPGWGVPTMDGTIRLFTKARPSDSTDITVEVKPGDNVFNFELVSK